MRRKDGEIGGKTDQGATPSPVGDRLTDSGMMRGFDFAVRAAHSHHVYKIYCFLPCVVFSAFGSTADACAWF
jgi:hypothetical protein